MHRLYCTTLCAIRVYKSVFEPELPLLVGLQVESCKGKEGEGEEEEEEEEGDLFDKILLALDRSVYLLLGSQG